MTRPYGSHTDSVPPAPAAELRDHHGCVARLHDLSGRAGGGRDAWSVIFWRGAGDKAGGVADVTDDELQAFITAAQAALDAKRGRDR